MLGEFLSRFARLHRLLWMEERVSSLEMRTDHQRDRLRKLGNRVEALERSRERQGQFLKRQVRLLKRLENHADALKSSLAVPDELIDEFHAWRASNPVPNRPLVTVIIATYNGARLLAQRSVPSVLEQTYDNLELIVVGDGCTDGTEEAMARIDDPRVTFMNLPERGEYPEEPLRRWMVAGTPALNKGLSMAAGHYVTHLDDDDEYLPDRLEKLVRFATENSYDFVWHPFYRQNQEGGWELNNAARLAFTHVTTSSVFYRSWFRKIPWDIEAHRLQEPGDWNRFRRIKYIGPEMARYPEPLLRHYQERSRIQ